VSYTKGQTDGRSGFLSLYQAAQSSTFRFSAIPSTLGDGGTLITGKPIFPELSWPAAEFGSPLVAMVLGGASKNFRAWKVVSSK